VCAESDWTTALQESLPAAAEWIRGDLLIALRGVLLGKGNFEISAPLVSAALAADKERHRFYLGRLGALQTQVGSDTGASDTDDITRGENAVFNGAASDADSGVWKVEVVTDETAPQTQTDDSSPFYSVTFALLDEGTAAAEAEPSRRGGRSNGPSRWGAAIL